MKDDWIEISFGIEDINDYERWIYKHKSGIAPDSATRNPALAGNLFGEVVNRDACEKAVEENRIFFYRIRYESK